MIDIVFVADFFVDEIIGGGELNNDELVEILKSLGHQVRCLKSNNCTPDFINNNVDSNYIIGNFITLPQASKDILEQRCRYLIYEHDHKYVKSRDPSCYKDYIAPPDQIINYSFYKNSRGIITQSLLHKTVVEKNLKLNNIYSVGGNLWSNKVLNKLEKLSKKTKKDKYSIWNSYNPIKCTSLAKAYCYKKNLEIDCVGPLPYDEFLEKITDNKTFVFFPQTLETLGRVVVECRMSGMTVISNNKVGALSEDWFKLKGLNLIEKMREKRDQIPKMVLEILKK